MFYCYIFVHIYNFVKHCKIVIDILNNKNNLMKYLRISLINLIKINEKSVWLKHHKVRGQVKK